MKHRKGRRPTPVQDTSKLGDDAFVTSRTTCHHMGWSRTTEHRMTKAGKFPKPVKIAGRNVRRMGDVREAARMLAAAGAAV